ncbi:UNVERIFIED_CONTAM: hypothetical protein FKN15_057216 [Acipenser sinensis]
MHSSTSVTDRAALQVDSCVPSKGVSSQGMTEVHCVETLTGGGCSGGGGGSGGGGSQQHQTTPSKRRTVLNISPPPEDLLDNSRMSCQDDGCPDSELSNSIWMEDSASNFSIVSSSSYNDNTEVPRKSRKRTPRQRPGPKPITVNGASLDVFDADSAKGPHFVLSQLGSDNKTCSKGGCLEGVSETVVLQIFVGSDSGRIKPHGFYQACRVTGRNTTPCKEVDIEGTTVIEVCLEPANNMTLAVDCVGILKLRNADVEARIGVAGSKKKSTRARLVFRVSISRSDGSILTLQTPSSPILCTQPAGAPEILKKSLHSCSVMGGEEVFLIGKNFLKGTKVIFQENVSDENSWKGEAEIDMELFHQNHLIVKVPPYHNPKISSPVCVGIYVVTNAGRSHEVQPFTYTPEPANIVEVNVKKEVPSPAQSCSFEESAKGMETPSCTLDKASLLPSALMTPLLPLVKNEDVTPMEVSSNQTAPNVFKTSDVIGSAQQTLDMSLNISLSSIPFSNSLSHQLGEPEQHQVQSTSFSSTEPLSTIQKQDIAPTSPLLQQNLENTGMQTSEGSLASQQQQQALENLSLQQQLQSDLFPSQVQGVMTGQIPMQCGLFQGGSGNENPQQQLSPQGLFQPQSTGDPSEDGGSRPKQMQTSVFQNMVQTQGQVGTCFQTSESMIHSGSQQQGSLFQQAEEMLSIQVPGFLQQPSSHPSPTQLFLSQSPMSDAQDPPTTLFQNQKHSPTQEQVQAAMFQSSLTVLTNSPLHPDQQQHGSGLFLSQNNVTTLQSGQITQDSKQQQQQLSFLTSLQSSGSTEQQSVSVFQPQDKSSLLQESTPMDQQPQQDAVFQTMPSSANGLLPSQQGAFFQSQHSMGSSQEQQQQQAGLLLFSGQNQMQQLNSSLPSQEPQNQAMFLTQSNLVSVSPQEQPQPMSFQNQSSVAGGTPQNEQPQQALFHNPQQMQLVQGSSSASESHVTNFMPQASLPSLQGSVSQQELPQATIFSSQSSIPSPVQPQGVLFHTAATRTMNQPGQPQQTSGLFLFGIQNADCGQLITSGDSTLSDQLIAISQSGQNQREKEASIQSLLTQTISELGTIPNAMTASQNMEKIDDLLVSLQDQSRTPQNEQPQQALFHNPQQMQLGQGSSSSSESPVTIFMPQASLPALQGSMSQQKLPQATIFSPQTSSPSPVQPQGALFHTAVTRTMNQPGQPQQTSGLFLFGIQNADCGQLIASGGSTLSDQLIAISQSGQNQSEKEASIQSLLTQTISEPGTIPNAMTASQNMEKIDDLLVSLQDQSNMTRSF